MNIKSLILSSASMAALLVASSASAADLPKHHLAKAPVAVMVKSQPAMFAWDGPYAGAEVGGNFSSFSMKKPDGTKMTSSEVEKQFGKPKNKLLGGVFAGYNANVGNNVILGIDGNLDFGKSDKTIVPSADGVNGFAYKEKLAGAARVRVGYAMDRFMPYVAGGLTVANLEAAQGTGKDKIEVVKDSGKLGKVEKLESSAAMGWNVGAGVDYAVSDNLILRADYRHSKISDPKVNNAASKDVKTATLQKLKDFSINSNDVRVGIAYKF